jgi:hypothetical protein
MLTRLRAAPGLGIDYDLLRAILGSIRDGVLRPRQTGTPEALLNVSPPPVKASAVELLINERREGR